MNRIPNPNPSDLPAEIAKLTEQVNLNLFNVWSNSVGTIKDVMSLGADHYAALKLTPHIRELVILLTAKVIQCQYEWVQHVTPAKLIGVTEGQIDAIQKLDFTEANFNPQELAAMKFSLAVLNNPNVSDDVFQLGQANFSNRELVEIVDVIGYYWMAGRIATVFKLDLDIPKSDEVKDSATQFYKQGH